MSALGHTYRWRVCNTQNVAITCILTVRLWRYDTTGALVYGLESSGMLSASLGASTGTNTPVTVDNSIVLWQGADLVLSTTAASATNGTGVVAVYLERSTDGGANWPYHNATTNVSFGQFVGAYNVTAADTTTTVRSNHRVR